MPIHFIEVAMGAAPVTVDKKKIITGAVRTRVREAEKRKVLGHAEMYYNHYEDHWRAAISPRKNDQVTANRRHFQFQFH